jgi:hypothetical protein
VLQPSKGNTTAEHLKSRLYEEWRKTSTRRILAGIAAGLGTVLALVLVLLLAEAALWLPPSLRLGGLVLSMAGGFGVGYWLIANMQKSPFDSFYRDFSRVHKLEVVRNILDLSEIPDLERSGLHEAALHQYLENVDAATFETSVKAYQSEHPNTVKWIRGIGFYIAAFTLFGITSLLQPEAFSRLLSPGTEFYRPNPFVFTMSPSDTTMEQGSRIRFDAVFEGTLPENVQIALRTSAESDYRVQRMQQNMDGRFISESQEVFDDLRWFLIMDGFRTPTRIINVQLLPRFTELAITVNPPGYTRLPASTYFYPFSRIEAYPGSELVVNGQVNQPLSQAKLISGITGDTLGIDAPVSQNLEFRHSVTDRDSLWFILSQANGLQNRNTFHFTTELLEDAWPEVVLLQPAREVSELDPVALDLIYETSDDFGISRVSLLYRVLRFHRSGEPETGRVQLPRPRDRISLEEYRWDLSELKLLPMDVVNYWVEVADNDAFAGFKTARSAEHILRISSLTDFLLAQEEQEDDLASRLEEFREAYEQNRREYDELRQQIMDDQNDTWEQSRAAEEIRETREELARQLEEIQEQFEQLRQDLDDGPQMSDATREMYEDLQRLMEEIDDPEILEAMRRLQEGLESMDRNQIRDAMQQIEFDEGRYQQRLERTIELFKSLQMNAELDRMNALLEDLARQEESLIGEDLPDAQEQVGRQQQIKQDLDAIKERLESMPERSPRRNQSDIENLSEELGAQMQQTSEKLQQDINEMNQGEDGSQDSSQQRRQEIRDQLESMRSQVKSAQSMMGQQSINVNINALLSIMQNLLLLSDAQEDLVKRTSDLIQGSAGFVNVAREQRVISRTFSLMADSLARVAAEVPRFPNLISDRQAIVQRHIDRAVELLAERDRNRSGAEQRVALGGINEIGSMLADLLEQLDNMSGDGNGDGSGGMSAEQMLEQLQKMSGDQARLNQQIQDMINDLAGERLMQDQMERLDQMARQQNEIRRQLRDLQQRGGLAPGDEVLSELQRLSEQMEEAINDLRGGVVEDRVVVQRQQNILSRMLQAERALNERDEDEERRGDRPADTERISPSELTLEALREQIRRRLQDPNQTRFTQEYQQLIQRYFEMLEDEERRRGGSR